MEEGHEIWYMEYKESVWVKKDYKNEQEIIKV
jgi:hypothetical protein